MTHPTLHLVVESALAGSTTPLDEYITGAQAELEQRQRALDCAQCFKALCGLSQAFAQKPEAQGFMPWARSMDFGIALATIDPKTGFLLEATRYDYDRSIAEDQALTEAMNSDDPAESDEAEDQFYGAKLGPFTLAFELLRKSNRDGLFDIDEDNLPEWITPGTPLEIADALGIHFIRPWVESIALGAQAAQPNSSTKTPCL